MQRKETAHCLLRFEKDDSLLGRYAEKQVEEIFQELCRQFDYTPPRKTAVDIFNQAEGQNGHAWFSTRVSGLPFIGTVAASTGPFGGDGLAGRRAGCERSSIGSACCGTRWSHVITLAANELQHSALVHRRAGRFDAKIIPGPPNGTNCSWLACRRERFSIWTRSIPASRGRESSGDWAMAYCQAELYVDYMRQLGGEEFAEKTARRLRAGLEYAGGPAKDVRHVEGRFREGIPRISSTSRSKD